MEISLTVMYSNGMEEYVSDFSAAIMWNIPCIETVIGNEIMRADGAYGTAVVGGAADTGAYGAAVNGTSDAGAYGGDITVSKYNARFRNNGKKVHSSEFALPSGAVTTREGRMVASPELLFLELASKLSIHRLILLGLQLCSYPPGHPSKAITTKKKLEMFLAKTAGYHGHKKAFRAIKYVENGSASIMESLTYMILGLPHALGGYGLYGAVFNQEIRLNGEAKMRLGQDRCFVDLYYKQAKLGVEYESFTHHSSPSEQGKDAKRSAVLKRKGVKMLHLNTIQLYEKDACSDFAYNLAASLGRRMQIRTKKFDEMHTLLRELLPG